MGSELEEGLTTSREAFSYKMGLRKSANAQPINGTISQSLVVKFLEYILPYI